MSEFLHRLPTFFANHTMLVIVFVAVLLALVATEVMHLFRGYRELTPAALTTLINRENPLLIDLSSVQDFEKGHIIGARHVAMSQFDPENKELAKVKDLPVVAICKSGQTAQTAAQRLVRAGFKNVFVLQGGMSGWRVANMPTTRGR